MEAIDVTYHQDPECWWAESEQIAGWTAAADSLEELRLLVEDGVRFALERDDVIVAHHVPTSA